MNVTTINGGAVLLKSIAGNGELPAFGYLSKSVAGGTDVTLASSEYSNTIYVFTGTLTANINVIFPLVPGALIVVKNATSGAYTLTVKSSTGSGVAVGQNKTAVLFCDGTGWNRVTADA